MQVKLLFCGALLFPFLAFAQGGTKKITLEDLWLSGTFRTRNVPGFNAMKDGQHYTQIDPAEGESGQRINIYRLRDGKKMEEIVRSGSNIELRKAGIDDYVFSEDEQKLLLFSQSQNIYRRSVLHTVFIYDRQTKKLERLDTGKVLHASFSPDGKRVAYVKDNDLCYMDLESRRVVRVTSDGEKNRVINGNCDWVYEEEFEFTKAYEWSPNGDYLAYYRFDESSVPEFTMTLYDGLYPTPYKYKYPKAGEPNSKVGIYCYRIADDSRKQMAVTGADIYVPRIKWSTGSDMLCVYRLNRHQNKLELFLAKAASGKATLIYRETNPYYIEINDNLQFLKDGKSFVFNSERSGSNHLYRYDFGVKKLIPLTSGDWDVAGLTGIDEKAGIIYYTAAKGSPMQRKLYSVSLNGGRSTLLTPADGTHAISTIAGYQYFLDAHSTLTTPSVYTLLDNKGKAVRVLEDNRDLKSKLGQYDLGDISFMTLRGDSAMLNGWIIKPPHFDPSKKYPVLMYQYSGPGSQEVGDRFPVGNYFWHQMLAQNGYIIVCVDGTGTGFRGEHFKKKTYLQLGKYESNDQIAAARSLAKLPYVDKSRIGIWGWSYGGFMSSTCLMKGAEVFKAAVSVAPVTSWRLYDNIYTERYMRTPAENAAGYDDNAPAGMANKLKGKLLLIHGTGDDNVHVQNSMDLINNLIHYNKDYDSEFYPNRAHGISGDNARLHLYRRMTEFILANL